MTESDDWPESDERYTVLERLGRGGVATVYEVLDNELDEVIAVKVLNDELRHDPATVKRFKSELKLARRIHHPNVARMYHFWYWGDRLAIAEECISGHSLDRELKDGPLTTHRLVEISRYLCSALHSAHSIGIIHRDLKPKNVMIDDLGQPHIVDFGLAILRQQVRAEDPSWAVGTPLFMSPEQASSPETVDHRSDIYALGLLLFKMATGQAALRGSNASSVMRAHVHEQPPPPRTINPTISPQLEGVILRCLAKLPDERFDSALDVYEQLRQVPGAERSAPSAAVGRRRSVLVVDDDEGTRMLIKAFLDRRFPDIRLLEAADGRAGVEMAQSERPDFILLDILMPVVDGRQALRQLKDSPLTAPIPVAMLTGLSQPEEALSSKERGAAVFLNKPVQTDVLQLLMEKYLTRLPS